MRCEPAEGMSDIPVPHTVVEAFFDGMADDRRWTASEPFVVDPPIVADCRIEPFDVRNDLLVAGIVDS